MSYEIRKNPHCQGRLTPSERRALTYEKEPVEDLQELWEKYPEGGRPGWYCLVKSLHALYGWDEKVDDWTELGQGLLLKKHDKKAGMLLQFLNPGTYTEKNAAIPGEVVIVPMEAGNYTFYNTRYPRDRQTLTVPEEQIGQTVIWAQKDQWQIMLLPVYDYIHRQIAEHTHNRGIVSNNPNTLDFIPPAKNNDYVYFKDSPDKSPMLWLYSGGKWTKTNTPMPSAETAPLTEYARHGYRQGENIKTLAQVEHLIENIQDDIQGLTDNVDGGNAFTRYGGCRGIDGGNALTQYD